MINNGTFPNVAWSPNGGKLKNIVDTLKYIPNTADGTFTRPDGERKFILSSNHKHDYELWKYNYNWFQKSFHDWLKEKEENDNEFLQEIEDINREDRLKARAEKHLFRCERRRR